MHPGRNLRAVIFDLDGTLVDTADDFIPAVQTLREEQGLGPLPAARIRSSVSNGASALVRLALTISDDDPDFDRHRQRLLALYAEVLGKYAGLYPGLSELLDELADRNIAWGIATNKPRAYTLPLLKRLELAPAIVVCPEDVTHTKPDPQCLHLACAALNCTQAQAVYVGDHSRDIEAGRRAGMFTLAAAYGYIEPGDAAENWNADFIVRTSSALQPALLTD